VFKANDPLTERIAHPRRSAHTNVMINNATTAQQPKLR